MSAIAPETAVGELVRAVPARSRVFGDLGIDYCCGGKQPLVEACQSKGLDLAVVIAMLSAMDSAPDRASTNLDALTLSELCDHIEQVHHGPLRAELPRLEFMTRKVAAVHGDHEPRLLEVRRVFESFNQAMVSHTQEEDERIFPAIRKLEAANEAEAAAAVSLSAALERLEHEHDHAGTAVARFKELTDNYTPPDWACNTFRALYDGLAALEKDMHLHVYKENNVLFPRTLALAASA